MVKVAYTCELKIAMKAVSMYKVFLRKGLFNVRETECICRFDYFMQII